MIEEPTSGDIVVDGIEVTKNKSLIPKVRQDTAMVFQQFNLYPHMTVLDNLTIAPIKVQKVSKVDAEKTALEYLEKVGLSDKNI